VVDQRNGGPITIGYSRYGPDQSIDERLAVAHQRVGRGGARHPAGAPYLTGFVGMHVALLDMNAD